MEPHKKPQASSSAKPACRTGRATEDKDQKDDATLGELALVDLENQVKELTEQVARLTDIAGRAQADLQNAKVRMTKDQDDMRKYASEAVLVRLLPLIDNLQRAFQHLPDDLKSHEWVRGIMAIEQALLKQVQDMGLVRMSSLGAPVDPRKHEVLMTGPGEEGTVTEVFEEGYELHGKVVRPAKVKAGDGTTGA